MSGRGEAFHVAKGAWQEQNGGRTGGLGVQGRSGEGLSGTESEKVGQVVRASSCVILWSWAVPVSRPSTFLSGENPSQTLWGNLALLPLHLGSFPLGLTFQPQWSFSPLTFP